MFTLPDDRDEALRLAELAVEALTVISTIVGGATAGTAASVLTVVRVILEGLERGFEGELTVDELRVELRKLRDALATSDAAADAALQEKLGNQKE